MKLVDKLRGKQTEEVETLQEVTPENPLEQLNKVKQQIEGEIQKLNQKKAREEAEKRNREAREKAEQEEINSENQTLEFVSPLVNKIKEEAGDLIESPEFILYLLATCLAYELNREKLLGNGYHDNRLFRFIRAYKRQGKK